MRRHRFFAAISLAIASTLAAARAAATENERGPIDVGSQSQLLVDDYFIERSHGIELAVNPPRKMGRVLLPEKPWEAYRIFVQTVFHDGDV